MLCVVRSIIQWRRLLSGRQFVDTPRARAVLASSLSHSQTIIAVVSACAGTVGSLLETNAPVEMRTRNLSATNGGHPIAPQPLCHERIREPHRPPPQRQFHKPNCQPLQHQVLWSLIPIDLNTRRLASSGAQHATCKRMTLARHLQAHDTLISQDSINCVQARYRATCLWADKGTPAQHGPAPAVPTLRRSVVSVRGLEWWREPPFQRTEPNHGEPG